jgi:ABC-type lipoprotein release transport system permease subunit
MVKIYTVGYYSGFYNSLSDKILANGGHFEISSNDEEE